jgi:hypothetical protein
MFASPMAAGSLALLASLAGAPPGEPAPAPDARQTKAALLGCLTRNFIELEDGSSSAEVLGRTIVARCRLEVAACATINSCDAARLAPAAAGPKAAPARPLRTAARRAKPPPEKSWVASLSKPRVLSQKVWRFITKELRAGRPLAEGRS